MPIFSPASIPPVVTGFFVFPRAFDPLAAMVLVMMPCTAFELDVLCIVQDVECNSAFVSSSQKFRKGIAL